MEYIAEVEIIFQCTIAMTTHRLVRCLFGRNCDGQSEHTASSWLSNHSFVVRTFTVVYTVVRLRYANDFILILSPSIHCKCWLISSKITATRIPFSEASGIDDLLYNWKSSCATWLLCLHQIEYLWNYSLGLVITNAKSCRMISNLENFSISPLLSPNIFALASKMSTHRHLCSKEKCRYVCHKYHNFQNARLLRALYCT